MTPPTMPAPRRGRSWVDRRRRRHGGGISGSPPLFLFLGLSLLCSAAKAQPPSGHSPPNPYGSLKGGFGPAMGIIVVLMVSAFFFMVFFSIYLRQCGERRDASSSVNGGGRAPARSRRVAARGLDASVVQALPTLVYAEVKEHKIGKGALECAVCLSEFEDDETLRLLPRCDHVFHTDCVDVWLSTHTTCPVCRCNLDPAAAVDPSSEADRGTSVVAEEEEEGEQTPRQREREGASVGQRSEIDHVAIVIGVDPEAVASTQRVESKSRLRWRWSRSLARPPRFLRSHSMGHAPRRAGDDDCERYTLRLPDHIRRDVMAGKFQRYPSFAPAAEGGSTTGGTAGTGHRAAGEEGSSRGAGGPVGGRSFKLRRWEWAAKSDRWAFFTRTFSMVSTRGDVDGAGNGSVRRGECSPRKGATEGAGSCSGSAPAAGEGSVKGKKKVFPAAV